jgi:hypothetical protein
MGDVQGLSDRVGRRQRRMPSGLRRACELGDNRGTMKFSNAIKASTATLTATY